MCQCKYDTHYNYSFDSQYKHIENNAISAFVSHANSTLPGKLNLSILNMHESVAPSDALGVFSM